MPENLPPSPPAEAQAFATPPYERILVPVDLTEKNREALRHAREWVPEGGELVLLHVIEELQDIPFEELESFYRRLEERAVRKLARLAESLEGVDAEIRQEVVYGKRAREIVHFAEERSMDLIVLGSHPIDPDVPGEGWATLSYQVAILARCPVLLVK